MKSQISLMLLFVLLTLSGCDGSEHGTKIQGNVSIDGTALQEGSITFVGDDGNSQAFAVKDGKYTAYVQPGEKNVYFYAVRVVSEVPRNDYPGDQVMIQELESIIPDKYTKKGATSLTVGDKNLKHDFVLTK